MIDIAENDNGSYIPLKDVAARQDISKKYLEIIMKVLVEAGLVDSISGKNGGYRLAKDPSEYTALEIIEAAEGPLRPVACLKPGAPECPRAGSCKTLGLWCEYDQLSRDFFQKRKLSDLL